MLMEEESFGERLKFILKKKGISITKLANMCGLSRECISLYLNGKREPKEKTMYRICKGLKMTMADFYADEGIRVKNFYEAKLLNNYRQMDEHKKGQVEGYVCRIMEEERN